MCNACGFQCCGHDFFSGCGCWPYTCNNPDCGTECWLCGQLENEEGECDNPKCDLYEEEEDYY